MGFYDTNLTIFAYMSKLANETGAINLSQGFPDFDVDSTLISYVEEAMRKGFNQYAPMPGLPSLRSALSQRHFNDYGVTYHPDTEITITPGATQAIQSVIASTVKPGDEVLLFAPAYDCYAPMVKASGGIPVWAALNPADFTLDHQSFSDRVSDKTKLVIINNPHNPCGSLWSEGDVELLIELQQTYGFYILADEVYEKICFADGGFRSFCTYDALKDALFLVYSFGKTFHATGWKIGYVLAPEPLMSKLRAFYQFAVFSVNTPMQHALARYVAEADYKKISVMYLKKQAFFEEAMKKTAFRALPTYGSYFQLFSYEGISDKNDVDMAEWLTREVGVATIPVSVFYPERRDDIRHLRFCFAKGDEVLSAAADKLYHAG